MTAADEEFRKLIRFLVSRGIRPIVFANRSWNVRDDKTGASTPARKFYAAPDQWGPEVRWYIATDGDCPFKPQAASLKHVLATENLLPNEVVFLGNDKEDMQVAVNGRVLLLTAGWIASPTEYGFRFDSPRDVARFIDLFCLRDHLWFYEVPEVNLRCLGLASSFDPISGKYSQDAKETFKNKNPAHRDFWTKYLIATLYFSGLNDVKMIASYPGHLPGHDNEVVSEALMTFSKCFRITYCPDLIVRHTAAMKSQEARWKKIPLDHRVQLNSIRLTKLPLKNKTERYKNSPFNTPRSVLVVDDFTTEGYGLDSARAYLRAVPNVQTIHLVSLLRFPNTPFHELKPLPKIVDPFAPNTFANPPSVVVHPYAKGVVDSAATQEIASHFAAYDGWQWPKDLV